MTPPPPRSPLLGQAIKVAREEAHLSQIQLAEKLGVQQSTISTWEKGHARPNIPQLLDLAKAVGADVTAFLNAVEAETPSR